MDPENGSENAPNYEDVEEINVIDDHTVAFKLEDKNVAFLAVSYTHLERQNKEVVKVSAGEVSVRGLYSYV